MNTNEDQFEVHRGLKLHSGNNFSIDKGNLGMHWSSDQKIAEQAGGIRHMPEAVRVLHAKVSKSAIEEDPQVLKDRFVQSADHFEKEVPLKENAPVHVTGLTKFRETSNKEVKSRTRKYKPAREMRA